MKASDAVKSHVKWLKDRCKQIKKELDESKESGSMWSEDYYSRHLQERLDECVRIKVATEKYMKRLRHEGN